MYGTLKSTSARQIHSLITKSPDSKHTESWTCVFKFLFCGRSAKKGSEKPHKKYIVNDRIIYCLRHWYTVTKYFEEMLSSGITFLIWHDKAVQKKYGNSIPKNI